MSFVLIWFGTKPKQMAFAFDSDRPKQMRTNEICSFGTKPKQMVFGIWFGRTKQMRANGKFSFGTKSKQIAFGIWSLRTKQMRANGEFSFGTKPKKWYLAYQHKAINECCPNKQKIRVGTKVAKKIHVRYYMVSYQRTLYPLIVTMKVAKKFMVV